MTFDVIGPWLWPIAIALLPVTALVIAHRKGLTRKAPTAEPDVLPRILARLEDEAARQARLADYRVQAQRLVDAKRTTLTLDPTPVPPPPPPRDTGESS